MIERPLIDGAELAARHGIPDLRIVDASWHLPASGRSGHQEFIEKRIPGAVFFDLDATSAPGDLPHMLPEAESFLADIAKLGIRLDHEIVVYDSIGLFSAARVRWMFRLFGADNVSILDGGLPAWVERGLPVESGCSNPEAPSVASPEVEGRLSAASDVASATAELPAVSSAGDVLFASESGDVQVVDARSHARFTGAEPEARAGLRGGHVPGSISLPFTELLDNGRLRPNDELTAVFARAGVDIDRPIITTCGSGVTAAVLSLALECIDHHDVSLYDGSWAEWGAVASLPVERGV